MIKITIVLNAPKSVYGTNLTDQDNSNLQLSNSNNSLSTVTNLNTSSATEIFQSTLLDQFQTTSARYLVSQLNRNSFANVQRISGAIGLASGLENMLRSSRNSTQVINMVDEPEDISTSVTTQQESRSEATTQLNEQVTQATEAVAQQAAQTEQTNQALEEVNTSITNLLAPYRLYLIVGGIGLTSYFLFRNSSMDHLARITTEHLITRQPIIQPGPVSAVTNINVNIFSNLSINRTVPTVAAALATSAVSELRKHFFSEDEAPK